MQITKKFLATISGNIMEFYDFIVYVFLSSYIARLFFPVVEDPLIAHIMAFNVFASGYLTRALGAIFFGYIGDKYGRKPSLTFSIFVITGSTVLIGLLPTYETLGIGAPLLLVCCRLLQGFAVSGEEGGAVVYLTETFKQRYKALFGALILGSASLGILLGSLTCLALTGYLDEERMLAFGWRLPFLFSLILGLIALYLRLTTTESNAFVELRERGRTVDNPIKEILTTEGWPLVIQIIMTAALAIPLYLYTIFLPNYLRLVADLNHQTSLMISILSMLVLVVFMPLFGYIADSIWSYKKQFNTGCLALIICAYPIFQSFVMQNLTLLVIGVIAFGIIVSMLTGPVFGFLINCFPMEIRFSGVSIALNVSIAIFGSTAPIVGFYLVRLTKINYSPYSYMMLAGLIGMISLWGLQKCRPHAVTA